MAGAGHSSLEELTRRERLARAGGEQRYHARLREQGKLFVRDRLERLLDAGSFVENGLLARTQDDGLPADAVVCGMGAIDGRPVAVIANDSTVKAGAWGRQTIRKIIRQQEEAETNRCPLLYLVDSAGARLDEQFDLFIGREHAGRIFYNQARLSGRVPQICVLFGPSPAGAAYIPAFCDAVIMVDGNASAFLGSPRMVEVATGETVTAEEMAGARLHCETSGLGDYLAADEDDALAATRRYLGYLPQHWQSAPPRAQPREPSNGEPLASLIPEAHNRAFDVQRVITRLFDDGSLLEHKARFARELVCAFGRLDGTPVGILANQPKHKAGVLFSDSADKGAQFVQLCDAFGLPLVFLCDTPGFMVGSEVERAGIIRHGAKLLSAIASTSVPRLCVILRKAYGAGYFAMSGAGFQPDGVIALPGSIAAIMGPEAAVNAIHHNRIQAIADERERTEFVSARRADYARDLSIFGAASSMLVDTVVQPDALRNELSRRLARQRERERTDVPRRHAVIRG